MAALDEFSKGNAARFVENYTEAIECYNRAIAADPDEDQYFSSRAQVHIKLEGYMDAVADATKAVELNPKSADAFLSKGIASFHLDEFESAKAALVEGKMLQSGASEKEAFDEWIQKCDDQLKSEQRCNAGDATIQEAGDVAAASVGETSKHANIPLPTGPKTRYDWYQTETQVVVTILLKGVTKEQLKTDVQENMLSVTVRQPNGTDYSLELDLAHSIDPDRSTIKILQSKVEIKLKKLEGLRWMKLEGDSQASDVKQFKPDPCTTAETCSKYPSSSHHTRDWDKVVSDIKKEEKDEKLEGDAALNSLFQQIYSDGTDEVKKAMNKSFTESGGTVLSTNWKEIAAKQTDVKPPDGMEHKTWQQ